MSIDPVNRPKALGLIKGPAANFRRFQYFCHLRVSGDTSPISCGLVGGRMTICHPLVEYSFIPLPLHRSIVPPDPEHCSLKSDFFPSRSLAFPEEGIEVSLSPSISRIADYKFPLSLMREVLSAPNVSYRPYVFDSQPVPAPTELLPEDFPPLFAEEGLLDFTLCPVASQTTVLSSCSVYDFMVPTLAECPYMIPVVVPVPPEEPVVPEYNDGACLQVPFASHRKVLTFFNGPVPDEANPIFSECGLEGTLVSSASHIRNEISKLPSFPPRVSLRLRGEWYQIGTCCGGPRNYILDHDDPIASGFDVDFPLLAGDVLLYRHHPGDYIPKVRYVISDCPLLVPPFALLVEIYRSGVLCRTIYPSDLTPYSSVDVLPKCCGHLALFFLCQKRVFGTDYDRARSIVLGDLPNYVKCAKFVRDPLLTRLRGVPKILGDPPTSVQLCMQGMSRAMQGEGESTCTRGLTNSDSGAVVGVSSLHVLQGLPHCDVKRHVYRGMREDTGWYSSYASTQPSLIGNMAVHMAMSKLFGGELLCFRSCVPGGIVPSDMCARSKKQGEVISSSLSLGPPHNPSFSTYELWWASQLSASWLDYPLLRYSDVDERAYANMVKKDPRKRGRPPGTFKDTGGRYDKWKAPRLVQEACVEALPGLILK